MDETKGQALNTFELRGDTFIFPNLHSYCLHPLLLFYTGESGLSFALSANKCQVSKQFILKITKNRYRKII